MKFIRQVFAENYGITADRDDLLRELEKVFGLEKDKNEEIKLEQTCGACPKQYDAFFKDKQVGYLRLKHGVFRVDVPNCRGETIYEDFPESDSCFDSDEREHYLDIAKQKIKKYLKNEDTYN